MIMKVSKGLKFCVAATRATQSLIVWGESRIEFRSLPTADFARINSSGRKVTFLNGNPYVVCLKSSISRTNREDSRT